jgi:tripeptide aminopeptidase
MTPEQTQGREGFIHLLELTGTAALCRLKFILRDFERDGLAAKGTLLTELAADIAATEPRATIKVDIKPQYRNMRYWLETDMTPVILAQTAASSLGLSPVSVPIRGGTDGSRLTEMGIPTPNLFTGMQDIHGPLEWISVQDMVVATRLCLAITEQAVSEPDVTP